MSEEHVGDDARRRAHPPHQAQRPAHGRCDGPRRRPARPRCAPRRETCPTRRASSPSTCSSREAAAHGQVRRVRLVERAHAARAARPGGRRARRRATAGLGAACWPSSARISTNSGRRADVELDGDSSCSRRCASRSSTCSPPGARAEGRAIAAKGLTGSGYDGHSFWDTDLYVVPVLTLHGAGGRCRRAALAPLDAARRPERARNLGLAGAAFPWRTIHGEECSGYWPAGTAAFHVNADVADRRHPLRAARPATTPSSATWAWRSSSRRRACGARSATTTSRAAFASTASPAPTSTARSPTTTCTRT